jgi:hypothetical protein
VLDAVLPGRAYKNLADAGFPDLTLWHKSAAAKYHHISRVGIFGTSAGSQSALARCSFILSSTRRPSPTAAGMLIALKDVVE